MKFSLDFSLPAYPVRLSYREPVLLVGSCFAEHIGACLQQHRFDVITNPNGIVFNPISMATQIASYLSEKKYEEADLFHHNGLWHSWHHHGSFAGMEVNDTLALINDARLAASAQLKHAGWVMLTFGSAWVYERKETGEVVANCHKVPSQHFNKRLLSVEEIVSAYDELLKQEIFADKKVMISISPVRYVRDGMIENNLGKAVLLQAAHALVQQHENVFYFPAYEIVIDELRDYRFFDKDLVHPNTLAIEYVWERFAAGAMDEQTQAFVKEVGVLHSALQHRPLHPGTDAYAKFKEQTAARLKQLQEKYPGVSFD